MLLHCAIGAVTTGPPVETSAEPEEGCMSTTRLRTGARLAVEVDRTACVPAVLTRVISLGVWHWCPANVSYEADVMAPEPPQPVASAPPGAAAPRDILSYRPSQ